MGRKVVRLTLDHLEELTAPCRSCVFWQLDPVRRERVAAVTGTRRTRSTPGSRWCCASGARAGGWCWSTACPRASRSTRPRPSCRGPRSFATAPVSADAVLLTQVYVAPDARRGGLGRMLVQGMARDLMERGGIKAVEAFGDTRGDPGWDTHRPPRDHARGSRCVASVEFLGSVGFKTHRPHARHPRMRMDLRSALTWRDEVEAALEKLIGVVRPTRPREARPAMRPGCR